MVRKIREATARACILIGDMLLRAGMIMEGLTLKPERMRQNLDLGSRLIIAETVMMQLGEAIGRQHADGVVYEAARAVFVEGRPFADLLGADARVTAHLDPAASMPCWT